MAVVKPLAENEIQAELLENVQFFKGPLGVIPNSVRTMAHRPHLAQAFTDLNIAVMSGDGNVKPEFKRLIGFASSMASGCRYCQAHMVLASERFGATEARLNDVLNYQQSSHFSAAEKVALDFCFAASESPNGVTEDHAAAMRKHWSDGDIVEIMGVIALFGFLNRWNDSMGSALEDLPISAAETHLKGTDWEVGKHQ